jgi:hypothetical protein
MLVVPSNLIARSALACSHPREVAQRKPEVAQPFPQRAVLVRTHLLGLATTKDQARAQSRPGTYGGVYGLPGLGCAPLCMAVHEPVEQFLFTMIVVCLALAPMPLS